MGIIARYLAYSQLWAFLASLAFFLSFFLSFQMIEVAGIALKQAIPLVLMLKILGHIMVSSIPLVTPMAMLVATFYTVGKLSGDSNEWVAMRGSGISYAKLLTPFMAIAVLIAAVVFTLNSRITPYSKREARKVAIVLPKGPTTEIPRGSFFTKIPGMILFREDTGSRDKVMKNVFIHVVEKNGQERTIFASEGELLKQEVAGKWGLGYVQLILSNGSMLVRNKGAFAVEKTLFKKYQLPLDYGSLSTRFRSTTGMMSSRQLYDEIQAWKRTNEYQKKPKTWHIRKAETQLYMRINTPLLCIIFTLLGFALGIQNMRGRSRGGASTILMVLGSYYPLFYGGIALAKAGVVAAPVAILAPTLLALGAALHYFRKLL